MIEASARQGGADVNANIALAAIVARAKAANLPAARIDAAVKKAAGGGAAGGDQVVYLEGYAGDGVALLLECLTANRQRSVQRVRHILSKAGGQLAPTAYLFARKAQVIVPATSAPSAEVEEFALEAGADDVALLADAADADEYGGAVGDTVVVCDDAVAKAARARWPHATVALTFTPLPASAVALSGVADPAAAEAALQNTLAELDDDDDVSRVWHNAT